MLRKKTAAQTGTHIREKITGFELCPRGKTEAPHPFLIVSISQPDELPFEKSINEIHILSLERKFLS